MNYLAPLPDDTVFHDLLEVLEARSIPCPDLSFELSKYRTEERTLATPALEAAGYVVKGEWFDGERDSFGPLTRCIRAIDPYGNEVVVVYG